MNNIVCLKWGKKYSANYVNRLFHMVSANISQPFDFYCFTEDGSGIKSEINILPLLDSNLKGWWQKLTFFKPEVHDLSGDILFLDLDVVITGNIDKLFSYKPGEFIICKDLQKKEGYNSSVFRLSIGSQSQVWKDFEKDAEKIVSRYYGDQDWVSESAKNVVLWHGGWIKSFKKECDTKSKRSFGHLGRLLRDNNIYQVRGSSAKPKNTKIVLFHGKPDPEDVAYGPYDVYKAAPWITDCWGENKTCVVVTTYNRSGLIPKVVNSIVKSIGDKKGIDILIVDDGSTDNSKEIIAEWSKLDNVYPLYIEKNAGVNNSRQQGLNWCVRNNYSWVSFIDDDDLMTDVCINSYIKAKSEDPSCTWLALASRSSDGKKTCKYPDEGKYNYTEHHMGKRSIKGDFQHFFAVRNMGNAHFSKKFKNAEVWFFWCKLSKYNLMKISNEVGVIKDYLEGGISKSHFNHSKKEQVAKYKVVHLKKISKQSTFSKILYNYSRILYKNKNYKKSLVCSLRAIKMNVFLIRAYFLLFKSYFNILENR